ncbi:hypothetical protein EON65_00940 [archaeon]|nr:MAG: hypothetical protein EON65_00940 [archaeon]
MAKSLLLNVLVDVLGNYVEGLTRENLKLGVWSGKIEFSNLLLKESALDQLNLPIRVVKGSLNKLVVKVPWTALESKPVEVFVDGVYLLATPLDFSKISPEDAKKMIFASTRAKLKQVEDAVLLALKNQDSKDENTAQKTSYVQQLVTRIVDNLEVKITNLHIRYEDSYADPKSGTFSCGVTLEQILLTTTDETWTAKFVKREVANKASTAVHKLGTIQNATVYWNVSSESYVRADNNAWREFMHRTIYRNKENNDTGFSYMLKPPNDLQVKLIHREVCNETTPNVDVLVESSLISFSVSQSQYRQLMLLVKSFGELDRKKQVSSYRPNRRPASDPRGWWHYAYMLVVGKDRSINAKVSFLSYCLYFFDLELIFSKIILCSWRLCLFVASLELST